MNLISLVGLNLVAAWTAMAAVVSGSVDAHPAPDSRHAHKLSQPIANALRSRLCDAVITRSEPANYKNARDFLRELVTYVSSPFSISQSKPSAANKPTRIARMFWTWTRLLN